MKSMVVSKLKALIADEVNKQLAENYQELLSKLVKIDVEHMEEDMSHAIGAAYFMIGGRLIFTPVIYRDGSVDSISYIGDVENDKLYGLTKKMYKKITSVMANDFGEVMSKKNEQRASVDAGIVGQLFATPRTYSPKTASEGNDGMIISAMDSPEFRGNFRQLMNDGNYVEAMDGVYGSFIMDRADDLDTFSKTASDTPVIASKRRYETIASIKALPLEKRASAAIEIATNGFYQEGVVLNKVASMGALKFGEQLVSSSGNTVVAKSPGAYNFIKKDYSLENGFIARVGFTDEVMLITGEGSMRFDMDADRRGWDSDRRNNDGFLALEGSFFASLTKGITTILNKLAAKTKSKEKSKRGQLIGSDSSYGERVEYRSIVISPNADEVYLLRLESNPTKVGNKDVYITSNYGDPDVEIVVDPDCRRFMRTADRIICNPNMINLSTEALYSKYEADVKTSLLGVKDLDNPIVKTAEFKVGYKAGAYSLDGNAMRQSDFESALKDRGFNALAAKDIVKVAEEGQGADVPMQEMSQTLKAILAEITENKHTTAQLLQLMQQAQGQASEDGQPQGDETQIIQAIKEMSQMLGANGDEIIAKAKESNIPLDQIASELQSATEQAQAEGAGQQDPDQAQGQPVQAQVQPQEGAPQPGMEQDMANLKSEGFNQNMTPEMIQQLKEISDKDMFNAAIISYFVDANNAGDIIGRYIDEIDGGVVAMAKVMLFVETQKGKMTETIGEKQISVFINRGKNILNRMTDFVIDATLIQ